MTDEHLDLETPGDFPQALLAERYLGGEMSAETAAAFERALDDPELLEQLVAAVQVRDAVTRSSHAAPISRRVEVGDAKRWLQTASALAAATALGLVLAFGPSRNMTEETVVAAETSDPVLPIENVQQVLAPVWIDLRTEEIDAFDVIESFDLLAFADESDTDLSDVPDWMYAAVSLPEEAGEIVDDGDAKEKTL